MITRCFTEALARMVFFWTPGLCVCERWKTELGDGLNDKQAVRALHEGEDGGEREKLRIHNQLEGGVIHNLSSPKGLEVGL